MIIRREIPVNYVIITFIAPTLLMLFLKKQLQFKFDSKS